MCRPIRLPSARTRLRPPVLWVIVLLLTGCGSRPPAAPLPAPLDRPGAETLSSVQVAHDLELLRRALGASHLNLIGVSYGTRIAAEAVRQVPTAMTAR